MTDSLDQSVSAQTLARWLGVSPKVVYDLTKAGVIEHGPGRLYPLEDSVRRYCDHIRRQTARPAAKSLPTS
jgi:hypothetical protein